MNRRCLMWLGVSLLSVVAGCGCPERSERVEWPVMGTVAAVQWRGDCDSSAVVASVKMTFVEVERLLNAFNPESELSRLAPLPDDEIVVRCDEAVRPCYAAAFRLMAATGGAFNPRWRGRHALDLGAIAKGYAVDLAAERLGKVGADVLIDLGGNLRSVRGKWRVGVYDEADEFFLEEGWACATSAEYFRGKHIYDGRTGQAVSNGVTSVTVVCRGSAMMADGLSTALFVLGPEEGRKMLEETPDLPETRATWFPKVLHE